MLTELGRCICNDVQTLQSSRDSLWLTPLLSSHAPHMAVSEVCSVYPKPEMLYNWSNTTKKCPGCRRRREAWWYII